MTEQQRLAHLEWYVRAVDAIISNDAHAANYPTTASYRRGVLKSLKAMLDQRGLREAA